MEEKREQKTLFDLPPDWAEHWDGMPEYISEDAKPEDTVIVNFRSLADRRDFLILLGQDPERRKSIWFPHREYQKTERQKGPVSVFPNIYPIYIISKGRWDTRLTSKSLEDLGIQYRIVVEPQEQEEYARVIDPAKILILPFSNLGQGSIPARNWVWEHSISEGAERHWILDDNIQGFYQLNKNQKSKVVDFNPFSEVEAFVDRYENIAKAGMNYEFFAPRLEKQPPYRLNTRVYSCILLKNDIPYRWRGRYNEDTDLSLRILKDGWCTVLFNTVLANKVPTMTMSGGNTEELYKDDGRLKMAQSLVDQHPDIVKVAWKWNRWQHQVDYRPFKKNKLIRKNGKEE
jgi:hypothetical protein